jgi:hypothetical protein
LDSSYVVEPGFGVARGTPASTAASATVARIVSMLTVTPADASSRTTGKARASSVAADTRFASGLVEPSNVGRISQLSPTLARVA